MPLPALALAAIIGGAASVATNTAKGIFGGIQARKAKKGMEKMWKNRPTYERPQEAREMLDLYRQQAARTELPGQGLIEDKLGARTAAGARQVQKTASSSASALGAITDIYGREQDAVRDLGIEFAKYKSAQEAQLAQGLGQAAQYSDQEFQYNKQQPWDIKMNEFTSQRQAGAENMWSGISGIASTAADFAGTAYYGQMMGGQGGAAQGSALGQSNLAATSSMIGARGGLPNAQDTFTNTLSGMRGTIKK